MYDKYVYLVTDVEADGPLPGKHSMISLASVARDENGADLGEFEANLSPLPDATQDPDTMKWWGTQPEAWKYSTTNPEDPEKVMRKYAAWIEQMPGKAVLAAHPVCFDFMWVTWYLQTFLGHKVFEGPGVDIVTYAMATLDWKFFDCHRMYWPEEWLGGFTHSHKAIDDARGFANAFVELMRINRTLRRDHIQLAPNKLLQQSRSVAGS
jgi:hypothetical protein